MNLVVIAEHTINLDRLTGGFVLDAGCRNFTFAKELATRGCKVVALDADPTVIADDFKGVFLNAAISDKAGERELVMCSDPQARYLAGWSVHQDPCVKVQAMTISDLMKIYDIDHWDVVKLDVEGSEYSILAAWPGPVATQISVEFHEHCLGRPPDEVYTSIFKHLAGFGYEIVQHERDARMDAGMNFWDSLLTLKC